MTVSLVARILARTRWSRRRAYPAALLLLLVVAVAGTRTAKAAEAPDAPPVLLRGGHFFTPIETAGTGLAPEVKLRLTVDPQGRVGEAEMVSITPSTEYDEVFREVVLTTVGGWRYAPAREDGEPVEATLEWTVQFLPRTARTPAAGPGAIDPVVDEGRLARVFTLSRERQAERLKNYASLAERHLVSERRQRVETPRFVLISDAPDAATASTLASNLEAVFGLLDETLRAGVEPQPAHYKMVVYVYARRASFNGLAGELTSSEWANGLYVPPGLFAFHLEVPTVETLLTLLVHETVHSYADQHLVRPGYRLPPWLSEGLAEYFSRSEIQKGRLVPGQIREGRYVLDQIRNGPYRQTTAAGCSLRQAKQAVRKGEAWDVETLVGAETDTFWGEEAGLHYALSWLLVHFLRHGEEGWAEEEFPTLLLYAAEGYPAEAAIEAVYGRSPAELGAEFERYLRAL